MVGPLTFQSGFKSQHLIHYMLGAPVVLLHQCSTSVRDGSSSAIAPINFEKFESHFQSGPALVVVPMVPWNHSIFEKGAMELLDF